MAASCSALLYSSVEDWRSRRRHPISPLAGEMSGRTEGGVVERIRLATIALLASSSRFSPPPPSPTPPTAATSCSCHRLLPRRRRARRRRQLPRRWLCCRPTALDRFWRRAPAAFHIRRRPLAPSISLLSFAGFAILIAAGFFGSRDPLSNPLPLIGLDTALGRPDPAARPVRRSLVVAQPLVRAVALVTRLLGATRCRTHDRACPHGSAAGRRSSCSSPSPGSN